MKENFRCYVGGERFLLLQLIISVALFLLFCSPVFAVPAFCQISEIAPSAQSFKVSCTVSELPPNGKFEMRFVDRFAGIEKLSERVFSLRIKDANDQRILPEILGNGIYRFNAGNATEISFAYEIRLAQLMGASVDPGRYALTTSLGPQVGFILLADILPDLCLVSEKKCLESVVRLKINAPDNWQIATTERESYGAFEVADVQKAVFFLGRMRSHIINVGRLHVQIAIAGERNLSDVQVALMIGAIAREQAEIIGNAAENNFLVTLLPFPVPITGLRSSALTRGRSVIMLLNPDEDLPRTLKHYQKHLAHEMFHFYLPEAFAVRENFDWFWEGFSRYIGLLTLNRLKLLGLPELLDEMSNEDALYQANPVRETVSLLAASPEKFASAANYNLVYRKGTLVAWLYDLELRRQSKGQKNVTDVLREMYQNYRDSKNEIGNREVLSSLRKPGKFDNLIRDYIEGTKKLDLSENLLPYGLLRDKNPGRQRINVNPKLSAQQNAVLAQFGH